VSVSRHLVEDLRESSLPMAMASTGIRR